MISFPKSDVLAACAQYGVSLNVPNGIDGPRCMAAIASNESSLGANCGPRQEPAYSDGGRYANADLLGRYGTAAASSHGPWQMMFDNFTPEAQEAIGNGTADVSLFAQEFVRFFNAYVIRARHAQTLEQIGQVWNMGHIGKAGADPEYVNKLQVAYAAQETL